ncbi:PIG-L family deacetylase [Pseudoflavitalea sp. G-6-1-2]|uniref:PIG-L family deacetylase n=1 Tax=Pseudoflavitalea sp. G-6-1-2 TaxID=2728841 RepID=UPI00146CEAF7|nr:PIG-L family deacetylase [Pseudoflavitalea sp. G-6-1-2]NML22125.1 PIG-L family deacetylase [Pseudoflavitalea sp. G-6-1-2]
MRSFRPLQLILGCIAFTQVSTSVAQTPASYSSSDLYQQVKKLKVLGSVLYMAAHPDDENTRLLAWLSKDRLYRTGYLSLTRGDGGQNLIGDEQGIELGMIRTQELLAARRIDGAEQFFSRAYDFGFSKRTEEALSTWNQEKILADAVWVIRKFQPDVIITRFPPDSRAGHGHHSASAVIAQLAFEAAADPNRFPEQFTHGVKPWKVKRVLWNTFSFGSVNTTSDDQLKIDVGVYNAALGQGYGEISAESRSQHKSQGFGVPAGRGSSLEYFQLLKGDAAKSDILDDVNTSWNRIPGAESIASKIDAILSNYKLDQPSAIVPQLVALYKDIAALPDHYWKTKKLQELQDLIANCSGLWLEATANTEFAVQGDSIRLNFFANNRLGTNSTLNNIKVDVIDAELNQPLEKNRNFTLNKPLYVFATKPLSQPYWLEKQMNTGSFEVADQKLIGRPESLPAYAVDFDITIEGQRFTFTRPVMYKFTDPVKGELYRPLVIVPPATLTTGPDIFVFHKGQKESAQLSVKVTANKDLQKYRANVMLDAGKRQETKDTGFTMAKGMSRNYEFTISNEHLYDAKKGKTDYAQVFVELKNGKEEQPAWLNLISINYDHIPPIHYYMQDKAKLLDLDLKTVGHKIGYIDGAGDKVAFTLGQMGYEVTILKENDLTSANLKQFDAVITGVRAYNVHDFLKTKYDALMEYVKNGGNLIVQYNTNNNLSSARGSGIGPYGFNISRNRVTDENAKVNFLLPSHPVLNYPNKITEKDFEGWVQERGIYFAEQTDAAYQTPLSMADPDEPDQKGSLIIADYGKGKFVYTGLVFFRELPAGVPGAYRIIANIIALNKSNTKK